MQEKDLYELFKDAYEFEHERKDALNSRLSLVLTSLVVIIGAATYFINNIRFTPIDSLKIVFFALLAGLVISVAFAFYYLFRCLFFYKYRYIARPHLIEEYVAQLKEHNRKSRHPVDVGAKIEDYLKSRYSDAASRNRANNKTKHGYFIRTLMATFFASILIAFLAGPFYAIKAKEPEEVVYVNVKNFSEISKMSIEDQTSNPFEKPANPEPEPEPTLPTPPPSEDIKEAEVDRPDIETKMDQDE